MKTNSIFSLGLLISFFIPWFNFGIFTWSGYEFPISLDKLYFVSLFPENSDISYLKMTYFIYLIPILSIISIIRDLSGKSGSFLFDEFVAGLTSVVLLFFFLSTSKVGTSLFSIGYYLTGVFSILGIFSHLFEKNKPSKLNEHLTQPISDKNELLNQLSKLYDLKEKNVITEEIYEKEIKIVLLKLENIKE